MLFKQFINNKYPDWRKLKEQGVSYNYADLIDKFSEALEFGEFVKDDSITVMRKDMGNGQKTIVTFSNYKNLDSVV